jgi:type VI secretion system secreted protein VgrG
MVGFPAARLTDLHVCPMFTVLVPHVGGPIAGPGAPTVLIGKMPAARVTDMCVCVGPPDMIAKGSATVFTMKMPQARILDNCVHGGVIVLGCFTVLVGDGGGGGGGGGGGPAAALLARIMSGQSNIKIDGPPEFQLQTMIALAKLAATPTGLALLQQLDASPHTTTIKPAAAGDGNEAGPSNAANANLRPDGTAGPGSDATVWFNPDRTTVGSGTEPWQTRDPAIGLGHELIHASHYTSGTRGTTTSTYTDADGVSRTAKDEEQRTAGVGPHRNDPMTENQLRKEFTEGGLGDHAERPRY